VTNNKTLVHLLFYLSSSQRRARAARLRLHPFLFALLLFTTPSHYIKPSKYIFAASLLKFYGYLIEGETVRPLSLKIAIITE
jgi:hypothetical protein